MGKQSIQWQRLAAEVVAIVFGILLAIGLDTAWTGRQDRQLEHELLTVLQAELHDARLQLEVQLDKYAYLEPATKTVADLLARNGAGTVMVPDTLLAGVIYDMSYNPPTGTATTLLSSGQVDLLQSLPLRSALAGWPAAIEDGLEEQLSSWDLGDERLEPLLQAAVPNLGPTYAVMSLWQEERRIVNGASEGETAVTASAELWNAIYQQLTMIRNARVDLVEGTLNHLQWLEALVAQELQ